jgi:hypothetical protein
VVEAFQKDKNANVEQVMPKPAAGTTPAPKPEEAGAKPAEVSQHASSLPAAAGLVYFVQLSCCHRTGRHRP